MAEFTIGLMLNISRNITLAINTSKGVNWASIRKSLYWLSGVGNDNFYLKFILKI